MEKTPGSCTRKFRIGWRRGEKNVKPVPPRKLKPEPMVIIPKKSGS